MAGLLIFLPNLDGALTPELLTQLGLDQVIEPTGHAMTRGPGPGDAAGLLIAVSPGPAGKQARCRYRPEEQEWRSIGDPATHWLGWQKDEPPTSVDLARVTHYLGHPVKLADDAEYLVPLVVPHGRKTMRRNRDGTWLCPMPRNTRLTADCMRYYESLWFGGTDRPTQSELADLACRGLAVHYRLGPNEIEMLGMFDWPAVERCLGAMLDVPSIVAENEARKKNEDAAAAESQAADSQSPVTPPAGSTGDAGTAVSDATDP